MQGCPNQAIRIRVVERAEARQAGEAGRFLPGAPAPGHTLPTTVYRTERETPANLRAADHDLVAPQPAHPPLVVMLVLTQLAVGALAAEAVVGRLLDLPPEGGWRSVQAVASALVAFVALGASLFHLGRPAYAFRAVIGLRTSWLSREALGFGLFAGAAAAFAAASLPGVRARLPGLPAAGWLEAVAVLLGLASVFCSVMVYVVTRRASWAGPITGFRFFATTVLLGLAATHGNLELGAALAMAPAASDPALLRGLLWAVIAVGASKLAVEAAVLRHLRGGRPGGPRRVARLLVGELRPLALSRLACGVLGGLLLPALLLAEGDTRPGASPLAALVALAALLAGELLERRLFFQAAPASRMPGALR